MADIADHAGTAVDYADDIPIDEAGEAAEKAQKKGCCARCLHHKVTNAILRFLFSNVGLCIIVTAYTIVGALIFMAIELPAEKAEANSTRAAAQAIIDEKDILLTKILNLAGTNAGLNRTETVAEFKTMLDEWHTMMATAIEGGDYTGWDGTLHDEAHEKYAWDAASTILFTASILTTIGYGHISPKSQMGQLITIIYSVFALPLMSMFLINIGAGIADGVRILWNKACCYACWKKRKVNHGEWPPPGKGGKKKSVAPEEGDEETAKPAWGEDGDIEKGDFEKTEDQIEGEVIEEEEEEEDEEGNDNVPATLSLFIVILYLVLGTVVFSAWEDDWSLVNSLYFSFVTLTTLGFGDFVPGISQIDTLSGKFRMAFAALYIIVGLAVLAMGIDLITDVVASKVTEATEKLTGEEGGDEEEDEAKPETDGDAEKGDDLVEDVPLS